jgi:uncharacterized protein YoxC
MNSSRLRIAQSIAVLIIAVGIVMMLIGVIYNLGNLGPAFPSAENPVYRVVEIFWLGVIWAALGALAWWFLRGFQEEDSSSLIRTEVRQMESKFDSRLREVDSRITGSAKTLANDIDLRFSQLAPLDSRFQMIETHFSQLDGQVRNVREQIAVYGDVKGQFRGVDLRLAEVDGRIASTQASVSDLVKLESRLSDLEARLEKVSGQIPSLDNLELRTTATERQIGELGTAYAQMDARVYGYDERLVNMNTHLIAVESELEATETRVQQRLTIADWDVRIASLDMRLSALEARPTIPTGFMIQGEPRTTPAQPDDLQVIEGIGPKMEAALHAAGLLSFAQLANASIEAIYAALEAAGLRFAPSATTWSRQAALAAQGDWDALKNLQTTLVAGRDH